MLTIGGFSDDVIDHLLVNLWPPIVMNLAAAKNANLVHNILQSIQCEVLTLNGTDVQLHWPEVSPN